MLLVASIVMLPPTRGSKRHATLLATIAFMIATVVGIVGAVIGGTTATSDCWHTGSNTAPDAGELNYLLIWGPGERQAADTSWIKGANSGTDLPLPQTPTGRPTNELTALLPRGGQPMSKQLSRSHPSATCSRMQDRPPSWRGGDGRHPSF